MGVDGASVNLGVKNGLVALVRKEIPWVIGVHCLNHRLELAVKDALGKTYFEEVTNILTSLYYLYNNSPKRLRELRALGAVLEENINKPRKCHGTRWVQHRLTATQSLINSYSVVVQHVESMASDTKHGDSAKAKGVLNKITDMKFILHLLYFEQLLIPLSKLSLAWQYDSSEAPQFFAALDAMKKTLSLMKSNDKPGAVGGDLAKLLEVNDEQESAEFRGFALKNVKRGRQHFLSNYVKYIEALETKCSARFNMANETVFRASSLLDIRLWPTDQEKLAEYCSGIIETIP